MNDDLRALLRAAKADPSDDNARLVLADWLEERGDARGELVRVQVRRAALPAWDAAHGELARREADLLAEHGEAWLGPITARTRSAEFRRGLLRVVLPVGITEDPELSGWPGWEWVEGLEYPPAFLGEWPILTPLSAGVNWLKCGGLFGPSRPSGLCPLPPGLVHLTTSINDPNAADLIAAGPVFARLESLTLWSGGLSGEGLVNILWKPAFARLRRLDVSLTSLRGDDGLGGLATLTHPSLRELRIFSANLEADGGRALAGSPVLAGLRSLELSGARLGTDGMLALFESPHLAGLESLSVTSERMTVGVVKAIGRLPALQSLTLSACGMTTPTAKALAASPFPGGLELLDLALNRLDDAAIAVLTASPALADLRELGLTANRITDGGLEALAGSPIASLGVLRLGGNRITSEGLRILEPWLVRQPLVELMLVSTDIDPAGLDALRASGRLPSLVTLTF